MNKNTQASSAPLPPFETGQVWQMDESTLQIGLIGKTLVHFKHYRAQAKRAPVSLLNKQALARFLKGQRAILLPPSASALIPATTKRAT